MSRLSIFWLIFAFAALAAGCRSRSDLVEAELRTKDRQLRETRAELDRTSSINEAYEATIRDQRAACLAPPRAGGTPTLVKEIQIGRGTGGIDEDRCPGDEGILVVIVPLDPDGSAVKVAGNARITALQVTPEGLKLPLSTWEVSAAHLRRNWKSGLISTGYYVSLPWQIVPSQSKLRIIVTFTTIDGAVYEAEKDVTIRLGLDGHPPGVPGPPVPGPLPPPVPEGGSPLPPPTPIPGPMMGPPLSWQPSESRKPVELGPPQPRK